MSMLPLSPLLYRTEVVRFLGGAMVHDKLIVCSQEYKDLIEQGYHADHFFCATENACYHAVMVKKLSFFDRVAQFTRWWLTLPTPEKLTDESR